MLRSHCADRYNLSDPAMEDLLQADGLTLTEDIPGAGAHLGTKLFEHAHLARRGLRLRAGTIVDASIIAAPSSTKNRQRARDPEMHQTKKGNECISA